MVEEAYKQPRNDEAIIKLVGRLTLKFPQFFEDLETQRQLKSTLDEALYNYEIHSKCTDLIVSDIEEKMQIYIACRRLEGLSEKTLSNYQGILIKFAQFFHKPLSSITSMDIRMWLGVYKNQGIKESTINSKIFCLSKFFKFLLDEEYISKNPMATIKITKIPKRLKKVMNDEQMELLRNGCESTRDKLLIEFALTTGCRVGEIATASISNINWSDKSITVIGKGDKERLVYFTTKTKMLIEQYLKEREEHEEHDALFVGTKFPFKRIKTRAMQLIMNKVKDRAGLGDVEFITMHGCRRKFATMEISHGVKLEYIQKLMGHESCETTLRYAQISDNNLKHIYEASM
ncbi:tyrosine-type recombinase/integrase [Clostridium saccharoperbutylacetonicum]|uniref:tyrosine-type recombinase/integrase n=1 Tax=Clostridium saccharoperbutylacetonicum TaxID=36745 RepID=UPI0039EA3A3A